MEKWYYGTKLELVVHKEYEFAGTVSTYDAQGNFVDMKNYDEERKPIADPAAIDLNDPGDTGDDDPSTETPEWE